MAAKRLVDRIAGSPARSALGQVRRQLGFAASVALGRPFDVCVQVTNRCTMQCDFCGFWSLGGDPRSELTLRDYLRVSDELAELGSFLVSLEGGEPTLREDFPEIVAAFSRHHLPVVYTNGWTMDDALASALFGAGLTQAGVSIDYPDAERHDARRHAPGAFERAWAAVRALRDAAPRAGAQVHVMTVLMRDNQRDLEPLLELSARERVGHQVTLVSPGRAIDDGRRPLLPEPPLSARLLGLRRRHRHLATFREYLARVDDFLTGAPMPPCRVGGQMFNIGAAGDVTPCNERLSWVAGNVGAGPIGPIHARLREMRDAEVAGCRGCWQLCRGFSHVLGGGGSLAGWIDLSTRMSSR
jgi:MoaA/NifB/PqqE/SkfB family radical SAM enzyme